MMLIMNYEMFEVVIQLIDVEGDEPEGMIVSVGEEQPDEGSEDDLSCFYHFFPDEWEDVCATLKSGFKHKVAGEFTVLNHGDVLLETKKERMLEDPIAIQIVDDMSQEEVDKFNKDNFSGDDGDDGDGEDADKGVSL